VSFEKVEATWTKAKIGLLLPIFDNSAKAALTAVFWSSGLIDLTLLMIKSKAARLLRIFFILICNQLFQFFFSLLKLIVWHLIILRC